MSARYSVINDLPVPAAPNRNRCLLLCHASYTFSCDGVRGFMLDVYLLDNIPQLYHSISLLGTEPLSLVLNDMHDFLVANPNEIISIIFESYVSADVIATALSDANLNQFLHAQNMSP